MRRKTICGLAAALCILVIGRSEAFGFLDEPKTQPPAEEKVLVLIARQKIAMGTLIKDPERLFELKEYFRGQEPKRALTSYDQVKDKRLNKPLSAEQFVTADDLIDNKGFDLPQLLPAGMRAVAIRVTSATASGGYVLPNSRVDVILTVRKGEKDSYSRIIMQNMLVLAVDLLMVRDREKGADIPTVVTLAATPEEAEKLAMAQAMGELSLALRAWADDEISRTRGATPADIAPRRALRVRPVEPEPELVLPPTEVMDVPPGMRAFAIPVDLRFLPVNSIRPGARVDVIVTVRNDNNGDSWSRIFLQNMLVVSVQAAKADGKLAVARTVVKLAATPDEAEKLALARAMGQLSLILRKPDATPERPLP